MLPGDHSCTMLPQPAGDAECRDCQPVRPRVFCKRKYAHRGAGGRSLQVSRICASRWVRARASRERRTSGPITHRSAGGDQSRLDLIPGSIGHAEGMQPPTPSKSLPTTHNSAPGVHDRPRGRRREVRVGVRADDVAKNTRTQARAGRPGRLAHGGNSMAHARHRLLTRQ